LFFTLINIICFIKYGFGKVVSHYFILLNSLNRIIKFIKTKRV